MVHHRASHSCCSHPHELDSYGTSHQFDLSRANGGFSGCTATRSGRNMTQNPTACPSFRWSEAQVVAVVHLEDQLRSFEGETLLRRGLRYHVAKGSWAWNERFEELERLDRNVP